MSIFRLDYSLIPAQRRPRPGQLPGRRRGPTIPDKRKQIELDNAGQPVNNNKPVDSLSADDKNLSYTKEFPILRVFCV